MVAPTYIESLSPFTSDGARSKPVPFALLRTSIRAGCLLGSLNGNFFLCLFFCLADLARLGRLRISRCEFGLPSDITARKAP